MELTTYSEEVFSISRLFSSNTFPLEKLQNASFDSNTPPAFSVLGRHSRLAPAPESRRKRSVTKTYVMMAARFEWKFYEKVCLSRLRLFYKEFIMIYGMK